MSDETITLKENSNDGEKEAAEPITLMDKTPKEAEAKDLPANPLDIQLDHK